MYQHEKELLLICWHIGPEVVAKERYKIFFDLGKYPRSQLSFLVRLDDEAADGKDPLRTTPKRRHTLRLTSSSTSEIPTVCATT